MKLDIPSFRENPHYYFRYSGLGFIAVALIFYNSPNTKLVLGIGLFLLAMSFMKKSIL